MWPKIDRARRRLSGGASAPTVSDAADRAQAVESQVAEPPSDAASAPQAPGVGPVEDVVIILGGHEIDRLRAALERFLGNAVERPDTPARLERALSLVLARRDAPGKPRVLRRPAALSTPESWEIHLDGVDYATGSAVRQAGRTGVLVS
jgi:hypothetical protein